MGRQVPLTPLKPVARSPLTVQLPLGEQVPSSPTWLLGQSALEPQLPLGRKIPPTQTKLAPQSLFDLQALPLPPSLSSPDRVTLARSPATAANAPPTNWIMAARPLLCAATIRASWWNHSPSSWRSLSNLCSFHHGRVDASVWESRHRDLPRLRSWWRAHRRILPKTMGIAKNRSDSPRPVSPLAPRRAGDHIQKSVRRVPLRLSEIRFLPLDFISEIDTGTFHGIGVEEAM